MPRGLSNQKLSTEREFTKKNPLFKPAPSPHGDGDGFIFQAEAETVIIGGLIRTNGLPGGHVARISIRDLLPLMKCWSNHLSTHRLSRHHHHPGSGRVVEGDVTHFWVVQINRLNERGGEVVVWSVYLFSCMRILYFLSLFAFIGNASMQTRGGEILLNGTFWRKIRWRFNGNGH